MDPNVSSLDQQTQIPQIYAEKMRTARSTRSMEGERRVVTILMCDVVGSTEFAGKLDLRVLDPDEVAE